MEYQVFLANVKERLKEELHGQCPCGGLQDAQEQWRRAAGLCIPDREGGNFPVIYMEEYYERYLHGMEMERVIDSLINW